MGVILTGHDGRRAIVHHLCVHPEHRRQGIAHLLVENAEEALRKEGITKIFGLVFKDNEPVKECLLYSAVLLLQLRSSEG